MKLQFIGLENVPLIVPGDDLVSVIEQSLESMGEQLRDDDVLVLAQKIISKSEDRYLDLRTVEPTAEAIALAAEVDKEPNKVQAILDESNEVVRKRVGVLIVEHKLGFVQANAGIDQSNISHDDDDGDNICLLLPIDPDKSAANLRSTLMQRHGVNVGVIINDSIGRAWRNGSMGLAIGVSGFTALEDYIGATDIYGRELMVTEVAAADEMASGASLVMGQTSEKTPVVLVRGYQPSEPEDAARVGVKPLIREKQMDLFR